MTTLDATFLELEEIDASAHMHIGGVLLFDPSARRSAPPPIGELRERLAARLGDFPRFRQRLSEPETGGLHWPRWVRDEHFDIERHVWEGRLPEPAGERELLGWAGRYFSERLTRDRPLWEIVSLGLNGGRWALVSKTHHCMVDGVGSIDIARAILDLEPDPAPEPAPSPLDAPVEREAAARAGTAHAATRFVRSAASSSTGLALSAARTGFGVARRAAGLAAHPHRIAEVAQSAEALTELVVRNEVVAAPATSLNEPIGPRRALAVTEVALADVKEIKRALSGSVNDVVLAAAGTALRQLLIERGEELPERGLRAMVPVDIRSAAKHLELGNEITSLFVELPLVPADPARRYAVQAERAESLKAGTQASGSRAMIDLSSHAPPVLHSFLARALYSTRLFNLTITNVPGPQVPLYAFGSRMRAIWPLVPLAAEHVLGLAVFSYDGRLFFCFNADPEAVPELEEIAEATRRAIEELLGLVRAGHTA